MRYKCYTALAVALILSGKPELAKRPYLWAMTDPHAFNEEEKLQICSQLSYLWHMIHHMDEKNINKSRTKTLAKHRQELLKNRMTYNDTFLVKCTNCDTNFHLGAGAEKLLCRCQSPYCSKECQKQDWSNHKSICRKLEAKMFIKESYGFCSEDSRGTVNLLKPECVTFKITLSQ